MPSGQTQRDLTPDPKPGPRLALVVATGPDPRNKVRDHSPLGGSGEGAQHPAGGSDRPGSRVGAARLAPGKECPFVGACFVHVAARYGLGLCESQRERSFDREPTC